MNAPGSADLEPLEDLRIVARKRRRLAWFAILGGVFCTVLLSGEDRSPSLLWYGGLAGQLLIAILALIVVAAGMVYGLLRTIDTLGHEILWRRVPIYLGWHLLKTERNDEPLRARLARAVGRWATPNPLKHRNLSRFAVAAGAMLLAALSLHALRHQLLPVLQPTIAAGLRFMVGAAVAVSIHAAFHAIGHLVGAFRFARLSPDRRPRALSPRFAARLRVSAPTFIAIVGVAIGVWALIVVLSVMSGFESDLRAKILSTQDHVQIERDRALGDVHDEIPDSDTLLAELASLPEVASALPYVHGEVMLSSPTNISTSVNVKGMLAEHLTLSEHLRDSMVQGDPHLLAHPELLQPETSHLDFLKEDFGVDPARAKNHDIFDNESGDGATARHHFEAPERLFPGVLIGSELSRSLNVEVGSEVQLISPEGTIGPAGVMPRSRSFRVAGIFHTGMYEYDMRLIYLDLGEAQRFFDREESVNRIEVRVTDTRLTAGLIDRITPLLAPRGLIALDWKALNRSLFSALQLEKIVMFIVLGFIILVASFAIVASLSMIVMEKSREIAILKSMGTTNSEVRRTFMTLGLVIGAVGTSAGLLLGLGTCLVIDTVGFRLPRAYYIEFVPVAVSAVEVLAVVSAAMVVSVAATIYPSTAASRLRPVEGLRYE